MEYKEAGLTITSEDLKILNFIEEILNINLKTYARMRNEDFSSELVRCEFDFACNAHLNSCTGHQEIEWVRSRNDYELQDIEYKVRLKTRQIIYRVIVDVNKSPGTLLYTNLETTVKNI